MTILAIQDVLSQQKTLDEAANTFRARHSLLVKEGQVSGERVIMLTRDQDLKHSTLIQDEASLVVINKDLEIISKGLDRIYKTDIENISLLAKTPLTVEEWYDGVRIVVSKIDNTFLISTKNDVQGNPHSKDVLDIISRKLPHKGLHALFMHNGLEQVSWEFTLVTRRHSKDLYMVGATNLRKMTEFTKEQLDNLGVHMGFKRPKWTLGYSEEQVTKRIKEFVDKGDNLKGIIVSDDADNRFKIEIKEYSDNAVMHYISRCILKHERYKLQNLDPKYNELITLISTRFNMCISSLVDLYSAHKNLRTRKLFADKVKHNPFSPVAFALKDEKIRNMSKVSEVISPNKLLKIVDKYDHDDLNIIIHNIKVNDAGTKS